MTSFATKAQDSFDAGISETHDCPSTQTEVKDKITQDNDEEQAAVSKTTVNDTEPFLNARNGADLTVLTIYLRVRITYNFAPNKKRTNLCEVSGSRLLGMTYTIVRWFNLKKDSNSTRQTNL
ncbi:hypothetical protein PoB_000717700 [Plakobranchus ocellatus]|uniref:Uncharacterized protein n=1 Tax=Plakobranchus ocellatus TaxID=259542 RepID=A0AAV3YCR1_9GAST|nr:hypothetical protein PoB_000717700 [Plakobranchus ocellatus]